MSSTVVFWVVLLSATAAAGAFAWMARFRKKQRHDVLRERLRGSTTRQILADAQAALDALGWDAFPAAIRIRALGGASSDVELLEALKALWTQACTQDAEGERRFYDSGLVRIMEVLEERVVRMKDL